MSRGVNVSDASLAVVNDTASAVQEKLAARQVKRAAKAVARREKSDALKEEGNVFFRAGKYVEAANRYQQAIAVYKTSVKPVLMTNLAAAYLNLRMYPEAHKAAEIALLADPKSIKARYRRGMARKHMGRIDSAESDLRLLLTLDPDNEAIWAELNLLYDVISSPSYEMAEEDLCSPSDQEAPALDDDPQLGESLSESSDCEHAGNGIPCKFYNRTGCKNGSSCRYSHAPDDRSERDALGRNVCKYFLIGACKFGGRCSYLHSEEYLLHEGWWSTSEGIEKERKRYSLLQTRNNALGMGRTSGEKKKTPGAAAVGNSSAYVKSAFSGMEASSRKNGKRKKNTDIYSDLSLDGYSSDGGGMFGFTDSDVEELLCQGVKPWDDDAWDVLGALRGY